MTLTELLYTGLQLPMGCVNYVATSLLHICGRCEQILKVKSTSLVPIDEFEL